MTGIYRITNLVNGKVYIGESAHVEAREDRHWWELKHNLHVNNHLQAAWNLYGSDNFIFEVVEVLPDDCSKELRIQKESEWIEKYGGVNSDSNYNMITGVAFGSHSIESRNKIKETLKDKWKNKPHPNLGRKMSEEFKEGARQRRLGYKHSEETKLKMSKSQKGHTVSKEQREKLRQARLGKPSPMKGKHFSEEFREHNREAHLGQVFSDETRKKLSEAQRRRMNRTVAQFNLSDTFLGAYRSIAEAARLTGCPYGSIYDTCHDRQKTGGGYKWKFITKDEYLSIMNSKHVDDN